MKQETSREMRDIAIAVVIAVAVTGFFTGLQSPMNPGALPPDGFTSAVSGAVDTGHHSAVPPARVYNEMRQGKSGPNQDWKTALSMLQPARPDLFETIVIDPADMSAVLAARSSIRAFNGAPPTVPHPIDQMSAESCAACHTTGTRTASLRMPQMSHPWMANCTQCHVAATADYMPAVEVARNAFAGMPAPNGGPRAYVHAPPMIPHSTWMRQNCLSCHGQAGQFGIRTTHPWRQNCEQCHAPSSVLEQTQLATQPEFLPPPRIQKDADDASQTIQQLRPQPEPDLDQ